jgi:hypothetical protein
MNLEKLAQLKELVSRFRAAVIRTDPDKIDPNFSRMGDPGAMCILLARFLEENGFPGCETVAGSRNAAWHAWLELDGLIVDLAPDQFNEIPRLRVMPELYEDAPQGFVVTETSKSPWHSRMELYFREPASAELSSRPDLEAIFSAIRANLL